MVYMLRIENAELIESNDQPHWAPMLKHRGFPDVCIYF